MSHVSLMFPPGSDPRSPYLALPCLAAYLRQSGVSVSMHDLDIGGVRALAGPLLTSSIRALQSRFRAVRRDPGFARLLGMSDALPDRANDALDVFVDPTRFFQPAELAAARDTLLDCLDVASAGRAGRVAYSISPVAYDVEGVDPRKLSDLLRVTRDDQSNLFAEYWEESLFPTLAREDPLVVGVTITNRQQTIPGLTLARRLRERGYFVVLGGALLTKFTDRLRRLPKFFDAFADAVIAYEGETSLAELVHALESGRDFSGIPNLLYMRDGHLRMNATHVEDVDSLPCPDFDGLPLHDYLTPTPVLPLYLGKGCYYNRCKFCDIPYINHISPKAYRLRSVDRIADDLATLARRFTCRHVELTDEALPPRTLAHLADVIAERHVPPMNFVGYARLEPGFSREVCRALAAAGVRKLFFGLESGSQDTLDHMDKGIDLHDVAPVLRNCREAGIHFHLFSIVGFPEESEARARETYRFFEDNRSVIDGPGNSFDIHAFGLELRTPYAHEAETLGIVISPSALARDFVVDVGQQWTNSRGLSHDDVERLIKEFGTGLKRLYHRFHGGPGALWPAFEEFAVLYADYYRRREFPYRATLSDDDALDGLQVRWNPAVWVDRRTDGVCFVQSRYGSIGMTNDSFTLLDASQQLCVPKLLQVLSGRESDNGSAADAVLNVLNEWLALGILQVTSHAPVPTGVATP